MQPPLLINIKPIDRMSEKWSLGWIKGVSLSLFDKGASPGFALQRGKLLGSGRFIMCFMTELCCLRSFDIKGPHCF